jgi:hypothetical protein
MGFSASYWEQIRYAIALIVYKDIDIAYDTGYRKDNGWR